MAHTKVVPGALGIVQVKVTLASDCWILHFPARPGLRQPCWWSVETVSHSGSYTLVIIRPVAVDEQTMPCATPKAAYERLGAQSRSLREVWS